MSIAALVAGLVFLFNPHINIIDIMPDAIGYGLILFGILKLSHVNASMTEAANRFKTLFILALCKLPALYIYALISPEEQIFILLLSIGFGAAEAVIGFLAFSSLFASLSSSKTMLSSISRLMRSSSCIVGSSRSLIICICCGEILVCSAMVCWSRFAIVYNIKKNEQSAMGRPFVWRVAISLILELCVLRSTGEWNHIADVAHTRNEEE